MRAKEILKAVAFAVIFILILIPVSYITRTSGDVKNRFVGFYAEPEDTIDVVMIGSSPIHPYYVTPKLWGEYGFTTYQLSSNQQRPEASTYLIKEAQKTQNPSLYVFEMRQYAATTESMTENMAYTRGVTDNLKYSWNRIQLINRLVPDVWERYSYYFDIIKYHENWTSLILPMQLRTFDYAYPSDLKGYQYVDVVTELEPWDFGDVTTTQPLPDDREENLLELLEYLTDHNMQALFIVSPVAMQDETQMERFNYMKPVIEAYGYDFVNMNTMYAELDVDFTKDFYDGGAHMNAMGAEKCTAFLGDYIREHYELSDKRGQEAYTAWDEAYALWNEKLADFKENWQNHIE